MRTAEILSVVCIIAGLLAYMIWQNRKLEKLREQIDHFLYFPTELIPENSREGGLENLNNSVRSLEKMVQISDKRYKERETQLIGFIENLSHQMKTAITAIQIRLELAMFKKDEEKQKELENCQQCVDRFTEEVNRLLSSSLLAAHKTQLNYEETDITRLLSQVIHQLTPLALKEEKTIHFEPTEPFSATVDAFWMEQVFVNLIKNGVEHTETGTEVCVVLEHHGDGFTLQVTDCGRGIPKEDMERLFDRFYSTKGKRRGYGIGLSMSRDIVELHHGTIQVQNLLGQGAMFTVNIPDISGTKPYENAREM